MAVVSVLIGLQASRGDGRGVTTAEFLCPLQIRQGEVQGTHADGGAWTSGMVNFAIVRRSEFSHVDTSADAGAQSEAFFAGVVEAFKAAGRFLAQRPPEVTAGMRASGLSLRMFVNIHMDGDQMDMELPQEFLVACGRHQLGVYVISND